MKLLSTFLLSAFFLFTHLCCAQQFDPAKLDSFFDTLDANNKAMLSVAISKNNKLLYQRTIGYASVADSIKATAATKYRIGSISKTFTATMIFQLIDEGKLSLKTTLDKYYPTVANSSKITIGNLLNHRSGIHSLTNDAAYLEYMTKPKTSEEMLAIISAAKPDFQPDTKTEYSNSNYVLLGYIIEKITGVSYSANLKTRITSKLNLNATYYGGKTDTGKQESYSYKMSQKWELQPETDLSIPGGAGSLISTPTELTVFMTALLQGKLTSASSLEQMKTIQDDLGMGLFKVPYNSQSGYGHNGSIDGFVASAYYFPTGEYAVAICSNGIAYPLNDVLIALLSTCYNNPVAIPSFKSITLKPEELDKYVGLYSSKDIPLKMTVTKTDNILTAQATGQGAFPLTPTDKDKFVFDQAGIVMDFNPGEGTFRLKQGSGNYLFSKEK
ncbi:serine hydrolase [Dyadobacter sp. CY312]|uniref:serine hydrolase domain-containing protein n=1 Tax=Dyadobacter sp. CY312 TaxID=2907303 RepID=UPI001F3C0569|nr:serine hydrolase domain-containing protein [Dyadobacter sp. CY312]MCE7041506.1 beta-lactamase family protein [Dyadobacter sp. CY312]